MQIKNEFIRFYLDYVEETESPRIFHVWSVLSGLASCLGRRCWFPFGTQRLYPNMYVLLVGPPAVRKSTAMRIIEKRLRASTGLRFAPDDTGGQRQGLIRSLENKEPEDDGIKLDKNLMKGLADDMLVTDQMDLIRNATVHLTDPRDKHVVAAYQSEFAALVGHPDIPFLTFLVKIYDGEDYKYVLKKEESELHEPLFSILACTQPDTLAKIMPEAALGQGFTSRILFVFGNKKHKFIEAPKELDQAKEKRIDDLFSFLFNRFEGEFRVTKAAQELLSKAYKAGSTISDPRFIYYAERRDSHLRKMAMALAASRKSLTIEVEDIADALFILEETEKLMPEALGEFGMSPLSVAKQKALDFLRSANEPVSSDIMWAVLSRDVKKNDFMQIMHDLRNTSKIVQHTNPSNGRVMFTAIDPNAKVEQLIPRGLFEDDGDETSHTIQ